MKNNSLTENIPHDSIVQNRTFQIELFCKKTEQDRRSERNYAAN